MAQWTVSSLDQHWVSTFGKERTLVKQALQTRQKLAGKNNTIQMNCFHTMQSFQPSELLHTVYSHTFSCVVRGG